MVSGVQRVFKLINKENLNMKPLCWRDEGLSTHQNVGSVFYNIT